MPNNIEKKYWQKEADKPFATTSSIVNDYIESMKNILKSKQFGKIGIVFTVHEGNVVNVQEIRETKYKVNGETGN